MFSSKKRWDPKYQHVYITGGSQGLGLAVAKLVAQKGAHVSIVARTQSKLDSALNEIEACRQSPDQIFKAFSFALDTAEMSAAALRAASDAHGGHVPDAVFACAGSSKPMFFLEMEEKDMTQGMVNGYWVQAWTAFAAAKQMAREGKKGKIVLVSSTLGYISFIGWASYSPAKHAIRGLGDTLRSELMLYGIEVQTFFPATIFTPGYEEEMKTKPSISREIESADEGQTAEQCAHGMLEGIERGDAHITSDIGTSMFRATTRGLAPRNSVLLDLFLDVFGWIRIPLWRRWMERLVIAHRAEHFEYLKKRGVLS
ncbi:hypothetical protein HYDPIDRAFT_130543 [Hydnomerulius pinastri MD-312]|nr:hypothetical protein HYDPIDRAFT_130543 [Hydnomerulius pinastri MD-312]